MAFFFSSRRRHTRLQGDWSSDVCSSDLTQATRDRMLAALPYPETKMILDNMPQPNVPINDVIGRYTDAKTLVRNDNTFLGKVDFEAGTGRLSVTASRMRPFASVPRIQINNNQQYTNGSKRVCTN